MGVINQDNVWKLDLFTNMAHAYIQTCTRAHTDRQTHTHAHPQACILEEPCRVFSGELGKDCRAG
jgi:hypothetical protein